jgi:signal transduction histidine kinase
MPPPPPPFNVGRVKPTLVTWCSAIAYAIVLVLALTRVLPDSLLLLASVFAIGLIRRLPLTGVAALLAGSLLTATTVLTGRSSLAVVGYGQALVTDVALAYAVSVRPRRWTLPAAAVLLGGQTAAATSYASGSNNYLRALVLLALAVATAWLAGDAIRARRAARSLETAQAVTAERLRIARDLHDLVAHSVGVIAIQAGVGARVIDTQPDEARNALAAIEQTSRETLAALRRVVGGLREATLPVGPPRLLPPDPSQPGLGDVERLAEAARVGGVRFDVRWLGPAPEVPPDLGLSAYRIVQEAVTNVLRHAHARSCVVTIGSASGELSIEVVDDGRGGDHTPGFGLTGMRERAELLHGHFTAGPRPGGGFRVAATLPLPAGSR